MIKMLSSLVEWQAIRKKISSDKKIGFVPTMGNLHAGHLSLLNRANKENDLSVVSIFVNPTQFNNKEDFENYPATIEQDMELAEKAQIDYVLLPNYETLYPDNYHYQVVYQGDKPFLENIHRPGHFSGVLTVVLKLLMLVRPSRAYFGEKDYEQLVLAREMAKAFFLDTEIIACPTVRNEFGLPLSSRNSRLSKTEYELAQWFPKLLHSPISCEEIKSLLIEHGFSVDYVEDRDNRRFAAIKVGDVRLIDNVDLKKGKKEC